MAEEFGAAKITVGLMAPREDLLTEPFTLEDGAIRVPSGPGLGVTVNDDTLHRHLVARWAVE